MNTNHLLNFVVNATWTVGEKKCRIKSSVRWEWVLHRLYSPVMSLWWMWWDTCRELLTVHNQRYVISLYHCRWAPGLWCAPLSSTWSRLMAGLHMLYQSTTAMVSVHREARGFVAVSTKYVQTRFYALLKNRHTDIELRFPHTNSKTTKYLQTADNRSSPCCLKGGVNTQNRAAKWTEWSLINWLTSF